MRLDDISINQEKVDWQACLQHWSWLLKVNPSFTILLVTKFAEIFVKVPDGSIWFISTANGSFSQVAESQEALADRLDNEEETDYFFMPGLISELEQALGKLWPGDCYGFLVPAIFKECEFKPSNFKITPIEEYLAALGQLLGRIKDQPDGQKVSLRVVE